MTLTVLVVSSAEANTAYDQISLRAVFIRQSEIQPAERALSVSLFRIDDSIRMLYLAMLARVHQHRNDTIMPRSL